MATELDVDLAALARMDITRLRALHHKLFGEEHLAPNAGHLRRKIAWHVQARRHGTLPESARQLALDIARHTELRVRIGDNIARRRSAVPIDRTITTAVVRDHDSRIPMPGSLLVKDFKSETHVVKVLDGAFEYAGRRFTSLSAIAHEITGTKWNGYAFFGLAKETPRVR